MGVGCSTTEKSPTAVGSVAVFGLPETISAPFTGAEVGGAGAAGTWEAGWDGSTTCNVQIYLHQSLDREEINQPHLLSP